MKVRYTSHSGVVLVALTTASIPASSTPTHPENAMLINSVSVLPDLVITATRNPRTAESIASNITVLTTEDIAKTTAQTIPDILRSQAGLQVSDFNANARAASVDIRGFGAENAANNTLVLVNGRRLNSTDIAEVDWTTIPLERIEKIEIVRGGGSVLYGDKAVGGVINIITKKSGEKNTLVLDSNIASYGTYKESVQFSGAEGPLYYALDGSLLESEGYRQNSRFRNKTSGISLGYDDGHILSLDLNAGIKEDAYGQAGYRLLGQDRRGTSTPRDYASTKGYYVQLAPQLRLSETSRLELGLNYSETEYFSDTFSLFGRYTLNNRLNESSLKPKLTTTQSFLGFEHQLTTGFDLTHTERIPIIIDPFYHPKQLFRNEFGAYFNDSIELSSKSLFLDLGYRFSQVSYDYSGETTNDTFAIHSYRFGLTKVYHPKSKIFISADRSFRNMLLGTEQSSGSLVLPPQTSWHYQTGISHTFNRYLRAGVTGFLINTTDEIFYDPNAGAFGSNTNYPKTQRRGVELELESHPSDSLRLFANYTGMNPLLKNGSYNGNHIPMVAVHNVQAGGTWSPDKAIDIDVRGRWLSDQFPMSDWSNGHQNWDGNRYWVLDTKVSYKVTKWLKVYAGVNNVFDKEYSEIATYSPWIGNTALYPSPKRNFLGGITITKEF